MYCPLAVHISKSSCFQIHVNIQQLSCRRMFASMISSSSLNLSTRAKLTCHKRNFRWEKLSSLARIWNKHSSPSLFLFSYFSRHALTVFLFFLNKMHARSILLLNISAYIYLFSNMHAKKKIRLNLEILN